MTNTFKNNSNDKIDSERKGDEHDSSSQLFTKMVTARSISLTRQFLPRETSFFDKSNSLTLLFDKVDLYIQEILKLEPKPPKPQA